MFTFQFSLLSGKNDVCVQGGDRQGTNECVLCPCQDKCLSYKQPGQVMGALLFTVIKLTPYTFSEELGRCNRFIFNIKFDVQKLGYMKPDSG